MNIQLAGHHAYGVYSGSAQGSVGGRAMDVSPDGTRAIVLGNFRLANGTVHDQIVMIDLGGPTAVVDPNWNTAQYSAPCANGAFDTYVEDVAFSQDGSYFAIAATGGGTFSTNTDGSRSLCDTATRWATSDTGANVLPTWVDYTGNDSFWSVAVTGTAIYFGGHARWINNPNGSDSPGAGALPRPGITALDPASGLPLTWNPGRNPRGAGAYALLATAQGLYVGSDTNYIGNYKYKHDELAFFPLSGGYTPAATTTQSLPSNVYETGALPNSTNTNVLYRVDAGGPALAATDNGPDWTADSTDTDPGAAYRNQQSNTAGYDQIANVNSSVPSTTPSAIFNTERWSPTDSPPLTWDFPVQAGTTVTVRLYFANRYSGTSQAGQRVFNVNLNGDQVLNNYDIVADTGDQTGTMKSFDITVPSDGTYNGDVDIALTHAGADNPLVNGIEILRSGSSAGTTGTTGGASDLAYRAYSGNQIGPLTTVANTGVDWSTTRGAFMVGSTIFYGSTSGDFYRATFTGSTVGTPVAIDPYDDPTWDNVQTGSGQTYQGAKSGFYSEIPNVTGAFYSDGRMYYSLLGQSTLFWRYFTPDSGTIGGTEFTVTGGDFSNTAGEFLSGSTLYYANRGDGTLHTLSFSNGGTNGANPSVSAASDATVSGPSVDGNDWRARGLFAYGKASFPDKPPVASATASCTNLSCSFNGSSSSDPDGSVASYSWNFGDGSVATGEFPTHGYASAGTFNYTLTVTDDRGVTSSNTFQGSVTTTKPTTAPISYRVAAHSYAASATAAAGASLTTPAAVVTGDTELLYVSTAVAGAAGAPAGWTQVAQQNSAPLQVTVYKHTVATGDAGSKISVPISATTAIAVQLADYAAVASITAGGSADSATATHTAPAATVTTAGSWVVSYWSDKSSTTTAWNLPSAVTSRDAVIGTGGGRVTDAIADTGAPAATGTYPAQTATVTGGASGKGANLTLVLTPQP
jgi:Malectin domain/PKD domain